MHGHPNMEHPCQNGAGNSTTYLPTIRFWMSCTVPDSVRHCVSDVSSVFVTELSSLVTACSSDSKPVSSAQLLCISGSTRNFSIIRHTLTIYSGHPTYCQVGIGRKGAWTIISPVTSTDTEVKNVWYLTATSLHILTAWCFDVSKLIFMSLN
jgi:hypothetical protein